MNKRVARKALVFCLAAAAALGISGCNYERRVQDSTYDYGTKQKLDPKMQGDKMYGTMTGLPGQHDNAWFEYSSQLSTVISDLNGVSTALVFLTDKNAYVGMTLDYTAVGTRKSGGADAKEQDNGGANEGVYNHFTGSPYWNNSRIAGPFNSPLTVNDHNQLSSEFKQSVAVRIRKLAPAVQEVHISANQEFVNHLIQYALEARVGHPLTPWTDSFNKLVKHQFAGGNEVPEPLDVQLQRSHQYMHGSRRPAAGK